MQRSVSLMLVLALVMSLAVSGIAFAETDQASAGDQSVEAVVYESEDGDVIEVPAEDLPVETGGDDSDLDDAEPADDIVPGEVGQEELPEPEAGSVDEAADLAEELVRQAPAAQRLHAAVMKLQGTRVWNSAHLISVCREINQFTSNHRYYLDNHPKAERAVVLLTDETVRLAHKFVQRDRVKFTVYRYAASTYSTLGCYKRAAAVTERALKLHPNRKAGYQDLKKLYNRAGAKGIKVFVRGQRPNFDVKPTVLNGRTLVPIRAISESMGAKVDFDSKKQKVIINNGTINVNLYMNNKQADVNGRQVVLDEPARAINGRTMIPLRFVSENLGAKVDYDSQSQTITVE